MDLGDMRSDLKSWGRRWNNEAIERIAARMPHSPSRPWPMIGMLFVGLVAGAAIGGYAVSQRSQMKRLAAAAHRMADELAGTGEDDDDKQVVVTTHRSNHRRKATTEV